MFSHRKDQEKDHSQALAVVYACNSMSRSKTGALIVLQQNMPLTDYEKPATSLMPTSTCAS